MASTRASNETGRNRHAPQRILRTTPLAKLPTIAQKLGEMHSRLMTARLAAYHAVELLDRGQECDAELMNAKLVNTESALTSARAALEIFAGRSARTAARGRAG